ncbi:MAG: RNB domain-containing ribonuclease [Anaerolineales bacterium]|nr:RNB domain-containing ribonuclease [Anaerolineales bacterium]
MNPENKHHRSILQRIAENAMRDRGLLPEFSAEVRDELRRIKNAAQPGNGPARDLRQSLWASIDNDDSRDLDQLTFAETAPGGNVKILVAVADVDSLVRDGSAVDRHARHNTTSVYTAARIFPMIPELLSTGLTSLNPDEDRPAVVVEMVVDAQGALQASDIFQARVTNHAKLAYNSVAAWLDGAGAAPEAIAAAGGLQASLRLQDQIARRMKESRQEQGALSLETIESKPVFEGDEIRGLETEEKNRAKELIENFMIAANGVTARYLAAKKLPSIRRVVRIPKRWDRIAAIAAERRHPLPAEPDSKALENFLLKQRAADPVGFPDLSLAVIKLLGSGEYIAERPDGDAPGHFGLAVRDYTHSTAPNRRYTDILTQRQIKAALQGKAPPYNFDELETLARHCTEAEDVVNKVERQVAKSAAALLLERRIGEKFDSIVTGAAPKGTWVRLLSLPVEGRLAAGFEGVDVGDRVRVQLASVDVQRGYIDFKKPSG